MRVGSVVCVAAGCVTFLGATARAGDEARFLSNIEHVITEGERSGEGYFSPDGKFLIYQSENEPGNPFFQIYVRNLETGETNRVSPGVGKTTCAFFRPGTEWVQFASTHLDPEAKAEQAREYEERKNPNRRRAPWDYDETFDIFACKRDGSGMTRLTDAVGYDAEGAYSPDGRQIVFCSLRDAYPADKLSEEERKQLNNDPSYFGEIYIMNADGSDPRRLTDWPGYDGGPFFSPDGERIIWRHFEPSGRLADVYTMKTDGTDRKRLTDFGSMSWAPYLHPSGQYAIFTTNKLGYRNFELFIVDAAGEREPVQVTFTDGFDGLAVFTPDGRELYWTTGRTSDGKSQIFKGQWNHDAALSALREAPPRKAPEPQAHGAEHGHGHAHGHDHEHE